MEFSEHLRHILALHFDPEWGAPYWIERAASLGFDPMRDIRFEEDLWRFPAVPREALVRRKVTDFVPRRFHDRMRDFITSETGGATGPAARTVFREDEFHAAFVEPFVQAARRTAFPQGVRWLFVGPSGPHIIGKAARACARATGAMDPFMVDFDPRWARKLPGASFARQRYLDHVLEQALAILRSQDIEVLFSTPPVLEALGATLEESIRAGIRGVHLGGMPSDAQFERRLREEWFSNARTLSGYGNSLAGMCPELTPGRGQPPCFFPHGPRLRFHLEMAGCAQAPPERGRVFFHRLDESVFLPNMPERDEAGLAPLPADAAGEGFHAPGLCDPRPRATFESGATEGLY